MSETLIMISIQRLYLHTMSGWKRCFLSLVFPDSYNSLRYSLSNVTIISFVSWIQRYKMNSINSQICEFKWCFWIWIFVLCISTDRRNNKILLFCLQIVYSLILLLLTYIITTAGSSCLDCSRHFLCLLLNIWFCTPVWCINVPTAAVVV